MYRDQLEELYFAKKKGAFWIRTFGNMLINCTLSRSTVHMLSIKDGSILHFLNFSITCLCHASANLWFDLVLLLASAPGEATLPLNFWWIYRPLKQVFIDIHHILDYSQL